MEFIFLWVIASVLIYLVIAGLSSVLEAIFEAIRRYRK